MSNLTMSDKITIGAILLIGVTAIWVHQEVKRVEEVGTSIRRDIDYVNLALEKSQREIRRGNSYLIEGNQMLRKLVGEAYGITK